MRDEAETVREYCIPRHCNMKLGKVGTIFCEMRKSWTNISNSCEMKSRTIRKYFLPI